MIVKEKSEARESHELSIAPRRSDSGPVTKSLRPTGGFRALIRHAGLADLVQLKCETRARGVVRVASGNGVGHLYFDGGQIVHATLGNYTGLRAALEILSWRAGSWDACERAWPAPDAYTLDMPWQGLLLQAAQREDEAARASRIGESVAPPRVALAPKIAKAEESGVSLRPESFEHAVRMDVDGNVLTGHGAVEAQAALAAYVQRLGDLVGQLIGADALRAFDGSLKSQAHVLVFRDKNGDTVALRARPGVDLSRFKTQLDL